MSHAMDNKATSFDSTSSLRISPEEREEKQNRNELFMQQEELHRSRERVATERAKIQAASAQLQEVRAKAKEADADLSLAIREYTAVSGTAGLPKTILEAYEKVQHCRDMLEPLETAYVESQATFAEREFELIDQEDTFYHEVKVVLFDEDGESENTLRETAQGLAFSNIPPILSNKSQQRTTTQQPLSLAPTTTSKVNDFPKLVPPHLPRVSPQRSHFIPAPSTAKRGSPKLSTVRVDSDHAFVLRRSQPRPSPSSPPPGPPPPLPGLPPVPPLMALQRQPQNLEHRRIAQPMKPLRATQFANAPRPGQALISMQAWNEHFREVLVRLSGAEREVALLRQQKVRMENQLRDGPRLQVTSNSELEDDVDLGAQEY